MFRKRTNFFKEKYSNEFQGIKRSKKGEEYATCTDCNEDISLASMGKTAIAQHQAKPKHVAAIKAKLSTQSLSHFLPSLTAPTDLDEKVTAAEGAWAYHVVSHHQSFKSADCVSSDGLFRVMERNLLRVETIKAILATKTNFDFNCTEMFDYLMKNGSLRDRIRSAEKY